MAAYKPRPIDSFADAVTRIMGQLTAVECGTIIGTGPSRVRAAADPDQVNYSPLNLEQALALDVAFTAETGEPGPILTAYRHQAADARAATLEDQPFCARLVEFAKLSGQSLHRIASAVDPKGEGGATITSAEARDAFHELDCLAGEIAKVRAEITRRVKHLPGCREPSRPESDGVKEKAHG